MTTNQMDSNKFEQIPKTPSPDTPPLYQLEGKDGDSLQTGQVNSGPEIATYYVPDSDGKPRLVADTSYSGEQVNVRRLSDDEVYLQKSRGTRDARTRALENISVLPLEEGGKIIGDTMVEQGMIFDDYEELRAIFLAFKNKILSVDASSIQSESIPKQGAHYLVMAETVEELGPKLEGLGYSVNTDEKWGALYEKGKQRIVLIYARERTKENRE